jgi:hypothetical protein
MCTLHGFNEFTAIQRSTNKMMQPNLNYTTENTIKQVHIPTIGLPGSCHTACIITNGPTQYAVLHSAACLPDHVQKQIQIDKTSTKSVLTLSAREYI